MNTPSATEIRVPHWNSDPAPASSSPTITTTANTVNAQQRVPDQPLGCRLGAASNWQAAPAEHASDKGKHCQGAAWCRFADELTHMRKVLLDHGSQYMSTTYGRNRHHAAPATPRPGVSRKGQA